MQQGKETELTFRCVGFREVWALLDLDRYDEIILKDMHRTDEKIKTGLIELFQLDRPEQAPSRKPDDEDGRPCPVSGKTDTGKSLGVMDVDTAKAKFL
jgi:hypothetical protein